MLGEVGERREPFVARGRADATTTPVVTDKLTTARTNSRESGAQQRSAVVRRSRIAARSRNSTRRSRAYSGFIQTIWTCSSHTVCSRSAKGSSFRTSERTAAVRCRGVVQAIGRRAFILPSSWLLEIQVSGEVSTACGRGERTVCLGHANGRERCHAAPKRPPSECMEVVESTTQSVDAIVVDVQLDLDTSRDALVNADNGADPLGDRTRARAQDDRHRASPRPDLTRCTGPVRPVLAGPHRDLLERLLTFVERVLGPRACRLRSRARRRWRCSASVATRAVEPDARPTVGPPPPPCRRP